MAPFDLCVLGAGPAGFAAAMRASDLGRSVLLVEADRVGGAGIHHGALSSKTLWELAKDYATACRSDRGYRAERVSVSYPEVVAAVTGAVDERRERLEHQLAALYAPEPSPGRVTRLAGRGRIAGPHRIVIDGPDGVREAEAGFVLVATGSAPRVLPGVEVDGRRVLTSDHLEGLHDFPERLVVLGAGVVGCEYATIFARFQRTAVHLLDREARILPFEDPDVSAVVSDGLRGLGATLHHQTRLVRAEPVERGVRCHLEGPGGPEVVEASHLLLSIGRVPRTAGLGLAEVGVRVSAGGAIEVDDTRTDAPWIYAAGDTTADIALANVAELEGRHAVERMFGLQPPPLRYGALSSILFLQPEVAAVGLNEGQARARGVPFRVAALDNRLVARNVAMRATRGFVKLLAHPDGRLLGLRVVGPQASSTVQGVALLIERGGTLDDIDRCMHAHPAIPEAVQECARLLLGRSIFRPDLNPGLIRVEQG